MLRDVVIFRHRWARAPVIHATNHVDHEKRVAWFSIPMHTSGSVPIVMMLRLATPSGSPELRYEYGAPLAGSSGRRSSTKKCNFINK